MKQKDAVAMLNAVGRHIERTGLIGNCYRVARVYGHGRVRTERDYTNVDFTYTGEGLVIRVDDGHSMMGGGELEVSYDNQRVLRVDRNENKPVNLPGDEVLKPLTPENPKVDGWYVCEYTRGDWEKIVKRIVQKGPKKEKGLKAENPQERELHSEIVRDITARFKV